MEMKYAYSGEKKKTKEIRKSGTQEKSHPCVSSLRVFRELRMKLSGNNFSKIAR